MLRLKPSIISLTEDETAEVIHRRRFRKFLEEAADNDYCVMIPDWFVAESLDAINAGLGAAPHTGSGKAAAVPPPGSEVPASVPVEDRPAPPSFTQIIDEEFQLPSELPTSNRREGRGQVGNEGRQRRPEPISLCMRPRHDPSTAALANEVAGPESSASVRYSPATSSPNRPSRESPGNRGGLGDGHESVRGSGPAGGLTFTLPPLPSWAERVMAQSPSGPGSVESPAAGLNRGSDPSTPRRSLSSGSNVAAENTPSSPDQAPWQHEDHLAASRASQTSQPGDTSPGFTPRPPGGLQVYNDSLPAESQPQTPQHLPEARRQSRLRGSYTAPIRRTPLQSAATPTTSRRRRGIGRTREPSPLGLQTPGFMGLYGGLENADDMVLFEQVEQELQSRRRSTDGTT